MLIRINATWPTILSMLITSTLQVDISLLLANQATVTCTGLPPGYCCLTPLPMLQRTPVSYPTTIQIRHLHARHIAGVFEGQGNRQGCTNIPPAKALRGPGSFSVNAQDVTTRHPAPFQFTGASYGSLPNEIPTQATVSEYLAAQGLVGLQTQRQQWTAPGISANIFSGVRPGGFKRRSRRDVIRGGPGIEPGIAI